MAEQLVINFFILLLQTFLIAKGVTTVTKGNSETASTCGNVTRFGDYSGHIFYKAYEEGNKRQDCTWKFDTVKTNQKLFITVYYLKLYHELWSDIHMPDGSLLPRMQSPNYREGGHPWCGGYYSNEESSLCRSDDTAEGFCPTVSKASTKWPPEIRVNAQRLTLSFSWMYLPCYEKQDSRKQEPVPITQNNNNDSEYTTQPPSNATRTRAASFTNMTVGTNASDSIEPRQRSKAMSEQQQQKIVCNETDVIHEKVVYKEDLTTFYACIILQH